MAMRKFPVTDTHSLGQFMMVSPNGEKLADMVTGTLRLVEGKPLLEVSPQITPIMEWKQNEHGGVYGQPTSTEPRDFTVLGSLAMSPRLVSLWGTDIVRTRVIDFAAPGEQRSGAQEMEVRWCLTGDAVADPDTLFDTVIMDVTNLHDWTGVSYTTRRISTSENGMPMTWTLDFPETNPMRLEEGRGEVSLSSNAVVAAPSNAGFRVDTNTRVKMTLAKGSTLETIAYEFAAPLASLMTILSGKRSAVRGIRLEKVEQDEKTAVDAYGVFVDAAAPQSAGDLLLRQQDVEADLLANWLTKAHRLAPVPRILESVWSGSIPTIETESLTLATTAEALHRILYPGDRRFTIEEIQKSKDILKESEVPDNVKESLTGALSNYWHEKSYPQRIEDLATPVWKAVPSCIGKLSRWKSAVVTARHTLAHGATGVIDDPEELFRLAALTRSLRWMLTFRLLLHCGVTAEELQAVADNSDRYQKDVRKWQRYLTKIYTAEQQ